LRRPWRTEEKEFLENWVKNAGGVPKSESMKFWQQCAEELNKAFDCERTGISSWFLLKIWKMIGPE
jgi:hypothetical protein